MGRVNPFVLLLAIVVFGLAIVMITLGLGTGILSGEHQQLVFQSPDGKSQPDEGWVTPVYDPMTTVTVSVEAREDVEVHMYSSNYRGGKLMTDENNRTVIRDEWLVAGEQDVRTGRRVVLSDFSAESCQYKVMVVTPQMALPSDTEYDITIEANTMNLDLINMGVILLGIFIVIMLLLTMGPRSRAAGAEGNDGRHAQVTDTVCFMGPAPPEPPPRYRQATLAPCWTGPVTPSAGTRQPDSNIYLAKG